MSPPTNGAVSLAYTPAMGSGGLTDALLLPFDGFTAADFLCADPRPPLCGAGTDQPPLLLLPCSSGTNGSSPAEGEGLGVEVPEVTTAVNVVSADAAGSLARAREPAPAPPSPALPLALATGQRTSYYRGVTRHRWTGRYEAHLWDNTCRKEGQRRKGRQVYLGGYDQEDNAARAYDLAALKYWGANATTNFPRENYIREIEDMQNMSRHDVVASLRRKSSGFSRGASIYRGVTRHHQHGRWQARIGRVAGNKDLYLGTFATEEEAAEAYDIAALKFRGENAVTNFEPSRYNLQAIAQGDIPMTAPGRRLLKHEPVPVRASEGQVALGGPASFSQQSSNSLPPCFFPNPLQSLPPPQPPQPQVQFLPSYNYSFGEPNLCWPYGIVEQKVRLDSKVEVVNGLLQLANSAAN